MTQSSLLVLIWAFALVLLLALFIWPERGLLAYWRSWRTSVERRKVEDALKYLFTRQQEGRNASIDALSGALHLSERGALAFVSRMQAQGLIEQKRHELALTPAGQRWALQIVRAHRLWERYLADEARMPLQKIHSEAHHREHGMTIEQVDELDASLGYPLSDPHGDPIPNAQGAMRLKLVEGTPLTSWNIGVPGKITQLEDEPPVAYAQLLAVGIQVGKTITMVESTPEKLTLTDGENEMVIAPAIAGNVFLEPLADTDLASADIFPLSELATFSKAQVIKLDERCQGFTRRRFLDLGLTPGTLIYPELDNAFKEPRAYRVRGTLIALRTEQATQIWVQPVNGNLN